MSKGWLITPVDYCVVVTPIDDVKEHFLSDRCWCSPAIEEGTYFPIAVHNSADGREVLEQGATVH